MTLMLGVLSLSALVPESELSDPARAEALRVRRPVAWWVARNLRPQEVARSPFFLVLPAFLFLGIGVSVVQRSRQLRRAVSSGLSPGSSRFRVERALDLPLPPEEAARRLVEEARRAGFEEVRAAPCLWEGGRGRVGFAGSLAFHVGLLLVLAGVVASALTRLTGEILLTEGFETPLRPESMLTLSGSGRLPDLSGCTLLMTDLVADISAQGTPVDVSALLAVRRGGEVLVERLVRVNGAFRWGGLQLTLHRVGWAPAIVAADPTGSRGVDGVAVLQLSPPGREDSVPLPGGGELRVALYPDFATTGGRPASRSPRPVNPVIDFSWRDREGRETARGRVGLGGRTEVDGYAVAFPALSRWGGFVVARDHGLPLFVLGSLVGSLGILLRLAFPDQSLRLAWEPAGGGTRVHLLAGTRFFPALHEEQVERLVSRLRSGER